MLQILCLLIANHYEVCRIWLAGIQKNIGKYRIKTNTGPKIGQTWKKTSISLNHLIFSIVCIGGNESLKRYKCLCIVYMACTVHLTWQNG